MRVRRFYVRKFSSAKGGVNDSFALTENFEHEKFLTELSCIHIDHKVTTREIDQWKVSF